MDVNGLWLLKLAGIAFVVFVCVPILKFYLITKAKQKMSKPSNKQKQRKREIDLKEHETIKKIYKEEREEYYLVARDMFKNLMKAKKLTHDDIRELENMLEIFLGEYIHELDNYTHKVKVKQKDGTEKIVMKKGFENQAHKIYVMMKSRHINVFEWEKIIEFLKLTQEEVKEEII